jgi:hypothetical protein
MIAEAAYFFPRRFYFFSNQVQISEIVHELGHMACWAMCPPFWNDPIARPARTHITTRWRSLTFLVINEDLRKIARISCGKQ